MDRITFELPPVGVKFLRAGMEGFEQADLYSGVSYCDAVRIASLGRALVVRPGSIEVCKWSPVILGLKEPESGFERGLGPRLEGGVAGVYLAPLDMFPPGEEPDVVIVRGRPAQISRLAAMMGEGTLQRLYRGQINKTALGANDGGFRLKVALTNVVIRSLARLKRWKRFDDFIRWAFRSQGVTSAFERILKRTMSSMSVCRNSTVIPFVEDAGNVSFFCTGGVMWGGNSPKHVTSGFPYRKVAPYLRSDA